MKKSLTIIVFASHMFFLPGQFNVAKPTEEPSLPQPVEPAIVKQEPVVKGMYKAYGLPEEQVKPLRNKLHIIARSKGLSEEKIKEIEVVIGGNKTNKVCPNGESGWNPNAVGDNGNSFGMVQINLPSHPNITKEQALDPDFALNFIVDEFLLGREWKWTCWKSVYRT